MSESYFCYCPNHSGWEDRVHPCPKCLEDKLHAYEKQWTDMDYTIGHLRKDLEQTQTLLANQDATSAHLRQENAELKARSKIDNEGNQEWINSLCKELCTMEDALGFKNDAYDKEGRWVPTIGPWLERLRDLIAAEGELGDLKEDLQRHKDALQKCREALAMAYEHVAGKADWFDFSVMEKALGCIKELSNPQPTQDSSTHRIIRACLSYLRNDNTRELYFDACKVLGIEPEVWSDKPKDPATAIAYGLYPSSARPANPKP